MKTINLPILSIFFLLTFFSCSSDDDNVEAPSVSYPDAILEAIFFESGNSTGPTINWNGNQGSFSLASTVQGLNINSTTGVISWTNMLKPGSQTFQVIVSNSAGQTVVNHTINNSFQGTFTGTYSDSYFYEMEFSTDGTVEVRSGDETSPNVGTGTYTLDGNELSIDYSYDNSYYYSTLGTITQSTNSATYEGDWYYGEGAVEGAIAGEFLVTLN
ncbi:hypothetical protein [Aestuariibaculum marinum]|uniref:Uncharacterized protein n=1 Tax=Aestuariibaculum marinum TaxID=2683592 RepID=A0A8J6Q393_9FLAO|nr:hypothetical protein [Aestuariibaculum marinum]MBD0823203.1 hypothetical protein [Aestuariibaculum marinum]